MASEQRLGQISPLSSTAKFSICVCGSFECTMEFISLIAAAVLAAACSVQLSTRSMQTQHRHVSWCVMLEGRDLPYGSFYVGAIPTSVLLLRTYVMPA